MQDITDILNYITTSGTFRILSTVVTKFWIIIIIIIIVAGLSANKEDNFIPISKIKGFIKK